VELFGDAELGRTMKTHSIYLSKTILDPLMKFESEDVKELVAGSWNGLVIASTSLKKVGSGIEPSPI
jgi:hypothetical protein